MNHKRAKRDTARARKLKRSTERVEKLVQLKRELIRKAELGVLGLVWRNQERWEKGVKRIKKEEPSSPVIKLETPPTPSLQYPPSRTSMSQFCSIDPNEFVWSPIYRPSPI